MSTEFVWPDFGVGIRDIVVKEMPYSEMRAAFNEMACITKFLTADIGWSDMILRFDDDRKFDEAAKLLTAANMPWEEREA